MELVHFETDDGIRLDGLWERPANGRPTVVHVHGKCGNFYQNDFIRYMFEGFSQRGIGFLSFNHRAHDCVAEGYRNGEVEYLGGSLESFQDCLLDIDAAITFGQQNGSSTIALQGHSNGAEKALYYWGRGQLDLDALILLSISDSYDMQWRWLATESPEAQLQRLMAAPAADSSHIMELALNEYGIKTGDKHYSIPVTKSSLVKVLNAETLNIIRIGHGVKSQYSRGRAPVLVCIAEQDPYLTTEPLQMVREVALRTDCHPELVFAPGTDHHFHGREKFLVDRISDWLLLALREGDQSA